MFERELVGKPKSSSLISSSNSNLGQIFKLEIQDNYKNEVNKINKIAYSFYPSISTYV